MFEGLLGQKRFFPVYSYKIIVPCTIVEVSRIWYDPKNNCDSRWEFKWLHSWMPNCNEEKEQTYKDFIKWRESHLTAIPSDTVFVDIDEPVGHSENADHYPETLEEARQDIEEGWGRRRRSKKHLGRILKMFRNRFKKSDASVSYVDKPVYV